MCLLGGVSEAVEFKTEEVTEAKDLEIWLTKSLVNLTLKKIILGRVCLVLIELELEGVLHAVIAPVSVCSNTLVPLCDTSLEFWEKLFQLHPLHDITSTWIDHSYEAQFDQLMDLWRFSHSFLDNREDVFIKQKDLDIGSFKIQWKVLQLVAYGAKSLDFFFL